MTPPIYKTIQVLKDTADKKLSLVFRMTDSTMWIRRELSHGDFFVYQQLQAANLSGIPKIIDVFVEEGHLVVIEEYIQSLTLDKFLPVSCQEAVSILVQLCDILESIHQLEPCVIHRDVKPENIFIKDGKVILFDFDIARQYESQKHHDTTILGSVGFAAPEQFGFEQTDPRSDVYSCGKLFLLLLSGKLDGEYKGPYRKVIQKALSMDPKDRYNSNAQMKEAILGRKIIIPGFNNLTKKGILLSWIGIVLDLLIVFHIDTTNNTTFHNDILYLICCFFVLYAIGIVWCNRNHWIRPDSKGGQILMGVAIYFVLLSLWIIVFSLLDAIML